MWSALNVDIFTRSSSEVHRISLHRQPSQVVQKVLILHNGPDTDRRLNEESCTGPENDINPAAGLVSAPF